LVVYEYERGNFRFFDKKALEKVLKERKIIRKSDSLK